MTTPKTFRDIATEQIEGENVTNDVVEQKETPEVAPTVQPDKETLASKEEVQTFAEKPNLEGKTPEELNRIYDEWQKKYTQTRQRETAELRENREKLAKMEQRLQQIESAGDRIQTPELQDEKDAVQRQFDLGNLSVQQYTERMRDLLREDARQIAREEFGSLAKQEKEESYQQTALEHFIGADPRLNEHNPQYDKRMKNALAADMADALDAHIAAHGTSIGFDYKAETDRLVREYDQQIDSIVKSRVQQTTSQAVEKAQKLNKTSTPGQHAKSTPGKKNIRQLLEDKVQ